MLLCAGGVLVAYGLPIQYIYIFNTYIIIKYIIIAKTSLGGGVGVRVLGGGAGPGL
jgi:hypothetical protein